MLILAGVAFTQPAIIIQIIGAYALIDGALKLVSSFTNKKEDPGRIMNIVTGLAGVIIGVIVFANPEATAAVVTYLIALWAIIIGVFLFIWGGQVKEQLTEYWLLWVLGGLSILFGILVFTDLLAGFMTLVTIFEIFMVIGGVLAILLAFRIKAMGDRLGLLA